jgi:hypothetical protein
VRLLTHRRYGAVAAVCALIACAGAAMAQADLGASLTPERTELFVYSGRDATLVRQSTEVALDAGTNTIEFAWRDATIDPSSIALRTGEGASVTSATFPAGRERVVLFSVEAGRAGTVPVDIAYMRTGLAATPRYRAVLSEDGTLSFTGYLEIANNTADDFKGCYLSVVAGDVRVIEDVAQAAARNLIAEAAAAPTAADKEAEAKAQAERDKLALAPPTPPNPWDLPSLGGLPAPPVRVPAALKGPEGGAPEYWVYPADGASNLLAHETRQLPFLSAEGVPVKSVVRFHPAKFGDRPHRVVLLTNDAASGLGEAPIPDGPVWLLSEARGVTLPAGNATMKRAPIGTEVELDVGAARGLIVKRELMNYEVTGLTYEPGGRVSGYDAHEEYAVTLRNTTGDAMDIEVIEEIPGVWDLRTTDAFVKKNDTTVIFAVTLAAGEERVLSYRIARRHGERVRG